MAKCFLCGEEKETRRLFSGNARGFSDFSLENSPVTRSRFGNWLPRVSLLAVLPASLFALVGGYPGILLLHLIAMGMAAFFAMKIIQRIVSPTIAALACSGFFLLPLLRDEVIANGPGIMAAALGIYALEMALSKRWILAGLPSDGKERRARSVP